MLTAQFVASLDPDAEVRLDLLDPDRGTYIQDDAFITIAPADFLGAPGGVGGDDGYARITVGVMVNGDEWAARRVFSALSRELLRPENYLRVQFSTATPAQWYHTWRTTPGPPDITAIDAGVWLVTVQVDADPYAIGEQVEFGITLTNDPTSGGVAMVLPDIVGDAPAPLVVDGVAQTGTSLYRPLLVVTPLTEWAGVQTWKVSAADPAWTTTETDVTDAGATGGSALNLTPTSGADATVAGLVTTTQAGTYRLFARVRRVQTISTDLTLTSGGAAAVAPTTQSSLAILSGFQFVDMGLYGFPLGNMPLDAADAFGGYTLAPGLAATVTLTASASSGVPSLHVDYIVAVPCELFESAGTSSMSLVTNGPLLGARLDGECERVGPVPSATPLSPAAALRVEGGFPMVTPGVVNVAHLLTKVQADAVPMANLGLAEPLGTAVTLSLKYRPRWLYLASS